MALNNAQIMTYESLGKVLDYIDERDSMQAVSYDDSLADVKKVVERSEETCMSVNGMSTTFEGKTYTMFGMIPCIGNESDNPVFKGYVTGKYTTSEGDEVVESLDVIVKYNGTSYAVGSITKISEDVKAYLSGLIVERAGTDPNYIYTVETDSDYGLQAVLNEIVEKVISGHWNVSVEVDGHSGTKLYPSAPNTVAILLYDGIGTDTNIKIRLYSQIGTKIQFGDAEFEDFGILDITRNVGGTCTATYTPVSISGGGGGGVDMTVVKAYVDPKFTAVDTSLNNKVDKETGKGLSTNDYDNDAKAEVAKIADKVDKETGKGLSTNDYTTTEKTKLAGIEEGAQKNVQSDWNATAGDSFIKNKPDVYTKTEVNTELAKKVDKVTGKDLSTNDFTDTLKTKLDDLYTKAQIDTELAKKVDKTADDYLTKAELITDGIKITPNKGSAIEYKLEDYVEEVELTSENLVKITQHDGTTVEQKPYLAKVETIQVDGLDEYKITDNKGVETKLDVYKRANTFSRDEDAVPTDLTTYGKKQIDDMIKALEGVTMKVVSEVPTPATGTAGTIYICNGTMYLCYENAGSKVISPIGGTAPDLTQYWKKTDGDLMSTAEHTKLTQDYTKDEIDSQLDDLDAKIDTEVAKKVDKTSDDYVVKVEETQTDVFKFTQSNLSAVTVDVKCVADAELEAYLNTIMPLV